MLDDYLVEIDESDQRRVVLAVPALHLVVMGRTLHEARALAEAAVAFRRQEPGHGVELQQLKTGRDNAVTHNRTQSQ
jgi:hypothetical protein